MQSPVLAWRRSAPGRLGGAQGLLGALDDTSVSTRIELLSGRLIGCGGLRSIVPGGSAEVSVVIGEPDVWGLGYGREAMTLLLNFGFEQLGLRTIWLIVRTENSRAVSLFTRLGFAVVETLEAAVIVRGVARNKLRMELSRDSWLGGDLGR